MKYIFKFFTLVFVLFVSASLNMSIALAQDPEVGKKTWEEDVFQCQKCHGLAGEGMWAGPRAGDGKTAQEWIDQVRSPKRNMPSFTAEQVSDQQIIDMNAYLNTLPKPEDFTPADAGLPDDAPAGQKLLVENRCVACHGDTGPIKRFTDRGEIPTAEGVIKQLRTPFKNMPSFTPEQVSDEEAALIAAFMADEVSAQSAPGTLPQSGSDDVSALPLALLLIGSGLVLTALFVRRAKTRV